MAIIFALVGIWGSMVHACEGTHRTHAGEVTSVKVAGVVAVTSVDHHSQDLTSEPDAGSDKGAHLYCCGDLQCYAGTGILPAGPTHVPSRPRGEPFAVTDPGRVSSLLSSLERPPRTSAQI